MMAKTSNIVTENKGKPAVTKVNEKAVDVTATVMPHGKAAKTLQATASQAMAGGSKANAVTNLGGNRSSAPRGSRSTMATGKH